MRIKYEKAQTQCKEGARYVVFFLLRNIIKNIYIILRRTPSQISGLRIRNSHMGLRKSNMAIDQNNRIEEEGTSTTAMNPLNSNRQGWKVLRLVVLY